MNTLHFQSPNNNNEIINFAAFRYTRGFHPRVHKLNYMSKIIILLFTYHKDNVQRVAKKCINFYLQYFGYFLY